MELHHRAPIIVVPGTINHLHDEFLLVPLTYRSDEDHNTSDAHVPYALAVLMLTYLIQEQS